MKNAYRTMFKIKVTSFALLLFTGIFLLQPTLPCFSTQGPGSITLTRMNAVVAAFWSFKSDLGYYPFSGKNKDDYNSYLISPAAGLGMEISANCLFTEEIEGFDYLGLEKKEYLRLWKGPYLDYKDPKECFVDGWGMPMVYVWHANYLFLWSAGPDGVFDNIERILQDHPLIGSSLSAESYEGDDITRKIATFKTPLVNNLNIEKMIKTANSGSQRANSWGEFFDFFW